MNSAGAPEGTRFKLVQTSNPILPYHTSKLVPGTDEDYWEVVGRFVDETEAVAHIQVMAKPNPIRYFGSKGDPLIHGPASENAGGSGEEQEQTDDPGDGSGGGCRVCDGTGYLRGLKVCDCAQRENS